jgi:DNA topoisomerase III
VDGQQCSMHITSVVGHLMQIEFDEKYMKWNSCNPEELFAAPIKKFVSTLSM